MKIIVIQFPDSADISTVIKGTPASVLSGETTVSGGTVINASEWYEPPLSGKATIIFSQ
jgi:hypothetical protein